MRLIDADELRRKWQDVLARNPEAKGTVGYRTFELFMKDWIMNTPSKQSLYGMVGGNG